MSLPALPHLPSPDSADPYHGQDLGGSLRERSGGVQNQERKLGHQ